MLRFTLETHSVYICLINKIIKLQFLWFDNHNKPYCNVVVFWLTVQQSCLHCAQWFRLCHIYQWPTSSTARTVSSWSSLSVMWVEICRNTWMDCSRTSSISSLNMSTRKSRHFSAKLGEDWAREHSASTAAIRTSVKSDTKWITKC